MSSQTPAGQPASLMRLKQRWTCRLQVCGSHPYQKSPGKSRDLDNGATSKLGKLGHVPHSRQTTPVPHDIFWLTSPLSSYFPVGRATAEMYGTQSLSIHP